MLNTKRLSNVTFYTFVVITVIGFIMWLLFMVYHISIWIPISVNAVQTILYFTYKKILK